MRQRQQQQVISLALLETGDGNVFISNIHSMLPSLGLHIRLPMAHEHIDFSRCYMASSIMHSFPPTVLYTVHHKAEIHSRGRTHVVAVDDQEMTTDARLQGESVPVPPTLLLSPSPSFSWEASPLLTHARGWRGQTRHRLPSLPGTQTHADISTHTHTHKHREGWKESSKEGKETRQECEGARARLGLQLASKLQQASARAAISALPASQAGTPAKNDPKTHHR